MFEARLSQGVILRRTIDALKELITDANIEVKETGVHLNAMDTSHVALVQMELKSDGFDPWTCTRPHVVGVNFGNLNKVLKCAGGDDVITLKGDDSDEEMVLLFESPSEDRLSEYHLRLMRIDQDALEVHSDENDAEIEMSSTEFARICRDMTVLSETVQLEASKGELAFTAQGELGKGVVILKPGMEVDGDTKEQLRIKVTKPTRGKFALKYLNIFNKAASLTDVVSIKMTHGKPLVVEYRIEDMGHVKYFLAPRDEGAEGNEDEE